VVRCSNDYLLQRNERTGTNGSVSNKTVSIHHAFSIISCWCSNWLVVTRDVQVYTRNINLTLDD